VYQHGTSEELVGRAIKRYSRREDIVLATKVFGKMHDGPGGRGLSRKAIVEQADASLTRLGTDYIDLYQIHRFDPDTPAEETMEALHDIVKAGKARYLGASSMYAWQFAKLQHTAGLGGWTRFVAMQNQDNLLRRQEERELLPMCADMGVGVVPYSPQGKGRLTRPWGQQSHRAPGITGCSSPSCGSAAANALGMPWGLAWVLGAAAAPDRRHRRGRARQGAAAASSPHCALRAWSTTAPRPAGC
jgi:aryl-alcohol dehydrogenase-like predicted oxidoreductase